jgi:transposase-like protein
MRVTVRQHAETFERQVGQVATALAAGVSVADAARQVGVSRRTVQRWLREGRGADADPKLRRLALRVDAARRRQRIDRGGVIASLPELHRVIDRAARAGSVEAMRLVHKRHCRESAGCIA